jgi:hypothetical protein
MEISALRVVSIACFRVSGGVVVGRLWIKLSRKEVGRIND